MPTKGPKPKIYVGGVGSAAGFAIVGSQATLSLHAPLPPNHPLYARIGRVASEWAHIEHILDLIIWKLADIHDKQGACITSQILGVTPRCKAIGALGASRLSANLLKKFRKLASDSFAVSDLRARIIHDPWYIEQVSGKTGQFKAMPASDLRYGIQDVGVSEINDTIAKIKALQERASSLRGDVLVELEPSQKKPGEG
jgi:hypothetical protein